VQAQTTEAEPIHCPTCGKDYPGDFSVCPLDATPLRAAGGDPLIGNVLAGTYHVKRSVAQGGMGRLYEGLHMRLGQPVAIKVMYEAHALKREAMERAELEARAMSSIRSDHVAMVLDLVRTNDGRPGLVTELLQGEDLQALIDREGKLPVEEAADILRQVCLGLAAAHEEGVVHRDLKPSNIFLAKRSGGRTVAKILDFGIAKTEEAKGLTQTSSFLGTPDYMAPEQAKGASDVDARADLYALGAILYHACTGRRPYGENDATTTLMRLLREEPPRAQVVDPTLPDGVAAVIEHLIARDPESRPSSADEARELLRPFSTAATRGEGVSARELTYRARIARPVAIYRAILGALVLGAWFAATAGTQLPSLLEGGVELQLAALLFRIGSALTVAAAAIGTLLLLYRGWRSTPKIEALSNATLQSVVAAGVTVGLLDILLRGLQALEMSDSPILDHQDAFRFGAALVLGVVVFLRERNHAS